MSEVKLCAVSKQYTGVDHPALAELDLCIDAGELAVLVGPSGCGKSTTLRIVAGLEDPSSGKVYIDGRDVTDVPPSERDIAMVFQSYALYPHLSVYDNLAFALRIRKLPERDIKSKVAAVAESLGIADYLDRKPKNLSGGQRQRVAIGRAVIREPKVFLFDEPLSNLDAKLRGEMRKEIARVHQRAAGTTALYVTHDQIEAMTLADRIVVLRDGRVQQVATPTEIYNEPANRFVAGFFGTPAMNFLDASVIDQSASPVARGQGFELPLSASPTSRDVIIGIRPEALQLQQSATSPYRSVQAPSIQASVELREVLGAEVLLHLRCQAGELTARADVCEPAREGDSVTLWVDPDKLHLFDRSSENRL